MMNIGPAAITALINSNGRVGAPVAATGYPAEELRSAGLITDASNLTRAGAIRREREMSAALDAAFS